MVKISNPDSNNYVILFFFLVTAKVAGAHNKDRIDAVSDPSSSGERNASILGRENH